MDAAGTIQTPEPPPRVADVERIARSTDPVLRNLEITECYYQLARACYAWTGQCANWCTFATWASRQAGRTIRGEDFLANLERHLNLRQWFTHPIKTIWRKIVRAGIYNPETTVGRLAREIHSPFDAFEHASAAVARGNLKVFEEIGREFARFLAVCGADAAPDPARIAAFCEGLRPGDPPDGQRYLHQAFARYYQQQFEPKPSVRAQMMYLANLEIGFHEQTRLQPEIREALDVPVRTAHDIGKRWLSILFPGAGAWKRTLEKPAAAVLGVIARAISRLSADVARRVITDAMMTLTVPGRVIALGRNLDVPADPSLAQVSLQDLEAMLSNIEPGPGIADDCGTDDWSNLRERMHFIAHLFRAFAAQESLFRAPFTPEQVAQFQSGRLPDGDLCA